MNKKQKIIIIVLIVLLILLDQIFKIVNINNIEINKDSNNNISYILISVPAIIIIIRYMLSNNIFIKMDTRVILTFAIAGATSNVIDRVWLGNVINYIDIPNFTPVNLAYIYIAITWVGIAIILTKYTVNRIKEKHNKG